MNLALSSCVQRHQEREAAYNVPTQASPHAGRFPLPSWDTGGSTRRMHTPVRTEGLQDVT
jgi:hypothetical protein